MASDIGLLVIRVQCNIITDSLAPLVTQRFGVRADERLAPLLGSFFIQLCSIISFISFIARGDFVAFYVYNSGEDLSHMENWMTLKETCKYLDLAPNTVYKLVRSGGLRAYQVRGVRGMKFKKEDVEALLTEVPTRTAKKKR
jgi:excisionase family DNA binding protein